MGTISRVTTWSTGDTLTAADLNGEFDNILSTANGSLNADNLGVTAGIASALKAVVLDANKDFADGTGSNQIRNLTISGSLAIGTTFLPDASGGADLGSATLEWGDVYIADDKYIKLGSDQNILIGYDETTTDSLKIAATEGAGLAITLMADEGDDAGDEWKLNVADGGVITLGNDIASAGTYVTQMTLTPHATVASSTVGLAGGLTVAGASQFNGTVAVGANDQGYDVILYGDTASAHVMWDTSADKLLTAGGATIDIVKDKLLIGSTAVTTTAAELNFLDTATAGTVVAGKAVVVDGSKNISSFGNVTLTGELDAATGDFSGDVDVDGTLEADAITLGGTALGSLYSPIAGSSSIVTTGTIGTGTWQGTAIALAYGGTGLVGATDGKIVIADGSGAPVLLDVGSSTAITTLGTVTTGTWQSSTAVIASAYLDADTAHLTTTQTFSGAKTFSAAAQFSNTVAVGVNGTGYDVQLFGDTDGSSVLWDQSADDLILTNAGLAVGSDATGDVYYRDANGFLARLGVGDDGQVLTSTGTLPNWEAAGAGGSFSGPGSSTENAIVRFTNTSGNSGDNSGILIDDSNNVTGAGNVTLSGELDAATGDFSGIIDVAGVATLASLVCTAGATFGGGYDDTGVTISTAGVITADGDITSDGTLFALGDTAASDKAAMGYTTAEGLILTGQGSTNDVTIKNDADTIVMAIKTGGTNTDLLGTAGVGIARTDGTLHVHTASAGSVTANTGYDDLVVEGSGGAGVSVITADAQNAGLVLGGVTDSLRSLIYSTHNSGSPFLAFYHNTAERLRIHSTGAVSIGNTGTGFRDVNTSGDAVYQLTIDTASPAAAVGLQAYTSGAQCAFGLQNAAGNKIRVAGMSSADLVTTTGAETASLGFFTKPAGSGNVLRLVIDKDGDFAGSSSADISDSRLKENVVSLTGCLAQVNALRGVSYNFLPEAHKNNDLRYGCVAQEVEAVIPAIVWDKSIHDVRAVEGVEAADAVLYVEGDEIPEGKNIGDVKTPAVEAVEAVEAEVYKSLHYTGLIPVFIEAIKELTARITALESA
jgi:fibronectin-binding autotransporter adhesin